MADGKVCESFPGCLGYPVNSLVGTPIRNFRNLWNLLASICQFLTGCFASLLCLRLLKLAAAISASYTCCALYHTLIGGRGRAMHRYPHASAFFRLRVFLYHTWIAQSFAASCDRAGTLYTLLHAKSCHSLWWPRDYGALIPISTDVHAPSDGTNPEREYLST